MKMNQQAMPSDLCAAVPERPSGTGLLRGLFPAARRGCARATLSCVVMTLVACGGSGGGGDGGGDGIEVAGAQPASKIHAGRCAPDNTLARNTAGNLTGRYLSGSLDDEKTWVRSYLDEAYLWYAEIPAVERTLPAYNVTPAQVALDNWFESLKTPARTGSGLPKDRFSFTLPTAQWNALVQTGVLGGYGMEWIVASVAPPRSARVAYVEAGSAAAAAGVARGDTLLELATDGVTIDFVNSASEPEVRLLNEAMFSPRDGASTTFRFRSNGGGEREVTLTASQVTTAPVKDARVLDSDGGKVGYLLFNDFILPGEAKLRAAIDGFREAAVTDLVLDLRYNGGGYLFMASQLAYMIAPPSSTAGKIFERPVFSDKRTAAGGTAKGVVFQGDSSGTPGSGTTAGSPLPNLALNRVYVLTTAGTCSASESVINGLRGVDVEVILIGAGTCGKPYGFTARDNCGLSYFPVEFQGVNHKGFGDFAEGFAPTCALADDLENPLGSEREGLLAAALAYRSGLSCEAITAGTVARKGTEGASRPSPEGAIVRPASRTGKHLVP